MKSCRCADNLFTLCDLLDGAAGREELVERGIDVGALVPVPKEGES